MKRLSVPADAGGWRKEGFGSVHAVRGFEDANRLLRSLGPSPLASALVLRLRLRAGPEPEPEPRRSM